MENTSWLLVAHSLDSVDFQTLPSCGEFTCSADKTDISPSLSVLLVCCKELQQIDFSFFFSFFFAIRLLCVCMVILGMQTAVAIVTQQATCCALISVPRTALSLSLFHSLSLIHTQSSDTWTHCTTRRPGRGSEIVLTCRLKRFRVISKAVLWQQLCFVFLTAHLTAAQ